MKNDGYTYYQEITMDGLKDIPFESIFKDPPLKVHKKLYAYSGPVVQFDKCIIENFNTTTYAISIRKARCNILYQIKKQLGLQANSGGIKLVNDIREVDS